MSHQDSQRDSCQTKLTAAQNPASFVVTFFPVRLVHAGNDNATAGRGMYKLVVTDINTDVTASRTSTEQNQIACAQISARNGFSRFLLFIG